MQQHRGSEGADDVLDDVLAVYPTVEEIAFAEELGRLYPFDDEGVIYAGELDRAPDPDDADAVWTRADDDAVAVLAAASRADGCSAADLLLLESVDPASLPDPLSRVAYLKVLDRVEAAIAARRYEAVLSLVPTLPDPTDYAREHALTLDMAVARRSSFHAAGRLVDAARAGRVVFPGMQAALAAGRVSDRHLRVLVDRTRVIEDAAVLSLIGEQALPLAEQLTPTRFQDALEHLIVAFDPDAPARRRRARAGRDAWTVSLPDGMKQLSITGDAATITAMRDTIATAAHALRVQRGGAAAQRAGDDDASIGACRSDAAAALILGAAQDDGSTLLDPAKAVVHVQVVMDLQTLRHEAANPVLLNGEPIPAQQGRELLAFAAWWRRIVTDPVDGHLLDYGRDTYLPRPLRDFVLARDGRCRIPGCPSRGRLQMDHALPFPAGPSTPANTGAISTGCHHAKTAGHLHLEDGRADGSATLVTLLGQRVRIPARPYTGWQPPPPDTEPPPYRPPLTLEREDRLAPAHLPVNDEPDDPPVNDGIPPF